MVLDYNRAFLTQNIDDYPNEQTPICSDLDVIMV